MASVETEPLEYQHDGIVFDGALAIDRDVTAPRRPAVLVFHGIEGRSAAQHGFSRDLARQGYLGVSVDLFGREPTRGGQQQCAELMATFLHDRAALRDRLLHVLQIVCSRPDIDPDRVAAIGFCFGGLCALDLARAGGEVAGVVSFHGLLTAPSPSPDPPISAKVLALHGWDDPYGPPADVAAFAAEMTQRDADWQLNAYGHAMHAFMSETADDPVSGIRYDARTAHRAWTAMETFLAEILS